MMVRSVFKLCRFALLLFVLLADSISAGVPPARIASGKKVYDGYCKTCHMATGLGMSNIYPPVAKSDYLNADKKRAISSVVNGLTGKIKVNGREFNGIMPPAPKTPAEIADVLTYVYSMWGNNGTVVTEKEVKAAKKLVKPAKAPAKKK